MRNPIFPISLIFLSGIIAASQCKGLLLNAMTFLYLSCAVIVLFFICRKHKTLSHLSLYLLIFLSGIAHSVSFNELPPNHIKTAISEEPENIFLRGIIESDPVFTRKFEYFPEIEFLLKIDAFKKESEWTPSSGLVIVKAYFSGKESLEYGNGVMLEGRIMPPKKNTSHDQFSYRDFLAAKKVYAVCKIGENGFIEKIPYPTTPAISLKRLLYSIKKIAERNILINLTPPHAGILIAMLLGGRHYLEASVKNIFIETGTMHILAISGLHVGIIVVMLLWVLRLLGIPRRTANIFAIIFIFAYALLVGARASVWRAAIMVSVFLFGFVINRQTKILNMLSLALVVLLLLNPNYIFDVGFVLSFLCIASLIWVTPIVDRFLKVDNRQIQRDAIKRRNRILFYLVKSVSISASVWLGIFPLTAYYFHILTPITILANLVAVPACFAMVGLGLLALFLNMFLKMFDFLYETIWLISNLLLFFLGALSKLPGSCFHIKSFPAYYVFMYYAVLIVIIIALTPRDTK